MFARGVSIRVKPNSVAEFNKTLENEILPLLQKQQGFKDELTLAASTGSEVLAISSWDRKEDAEAYKLATYPDLQKLLSQVIAVPPHSPTYAASTSTTPTTQHPPAPSPP